MLFGLGISRTAFCLMFTQKEKIEKGKNNMANIEYEIYSEKEAVSKICLAEPF